MILRINSAPFNDLITPLGYLKIFDPWESHLTAREVKCPSKTINAIENIMIVEKG